jgi:hypothetical protein
MTPVLSRRAGDASAFVRDLGMRRIARLDRWLPVRALVAGVVVRVVHPVQMAEG